MSERDGCLCEWRGPFMVRFAKDCPRLEDHKDRLWPERRLLLDRAEIDKRHRDRCRRLARGELTLDEAFAESDADWEPLLGPSAEQELRNVRAAIWGYFQLRAEGREAQAEGLLRSALPDDYRPVGAP